LKCKECKFKCHRDCESKVPPSCGLPLAFVDEFARALQSEGILNTQLMFLSAANLLLTY
jgi:kinase suppressor of Ras 2